jgi:hypothetical protein
MAHVSTFVLVPNSSAMPSRDTTSNVMVKPVVNSPPSTTHSTAQR